MASKFVLFDANGHAVGTYQAVAMARAFAGRKNPVYKRLIWVVGPGRQWEGYLNTRDKTPLFVIRRVRRGQV